MHWALWAVLCILVVLGPLDAVGRLAILRNKTRLNIVHSAKSNSCVLIVYYPGILADGVQSSLKMSSVWQRYGDVLQVSYDAGKFSPKKTTKTVADWIKQYGECYDTVVFIGSSMGGMLSYDTVPLIEGHVKDIRFILVDAPTRRSDFQAPLDKISLATWAWWAGPINNLLISKLYFKTTFRGPAEENIEPEVDRQELAKRVEEAKSFPISINNDWVRYIIGHESLIVNALHGYKGVYVRSERDHDTVRPEAYLGWKLVFGNQLDMLEADTTHAGFNERPAAWRRAFVQAFLAIGVC